MKGWRGIIIGVVAVGLAGALISAAIGYFLIGGDTGAKTPSHAEIESFGRIRMPPSARDVDATSVSSIDQRLKVRFTMDRADLDAFVRGARFSPALKRGYEPYSANELGWHLDRIRNTLGGDESEPGYGRLLVIDLDRPNVATVYLIASTS
jgi:hypothetical protein